MNLRILSTVTTGLSVALLALLLLRGCDKPVTAPDNTNYRVEDSLKREISNRDRVILNVRQKRAVDSLENLRVLNGLQMRNKAMSEKLKVVEAKVPESAEFDRYVELVDSTFAVKDSLYAQAVNHSVALDSLYRIEVAALAAKNVLQQEVSEEYRNRVEQLANQNVRLEKRLERKKRGNRIWAGIALGLGAAVGVLSLSQ